MNFALTAAGLKICMALGLLHPTYDECNSRLISSRPTLQNMEEGPTKLVSSPDKMWSKGEEKGWDCIDFATYDRYDLSKGTVHYCTRSMVIYFVPGTPLWHWAPYDHNLTGLYRVSGTR